MKTDAPIIIRRTADGGFIVSEWEPFGRSTVADEYVFTDLDPYSVSSRGLVSWLARHFPDKKEPEAA